MMDRIADPELRQQALVAAGLLYSQLGQYKLAHHYAAMVVSAPETPRHQCFAAYLDFDALLHLNAMPSDDGPVNQAIAQCLGQHEVMMANAIRGVLAKTWAGRGDSEKALAALQEHLTEISESHYPRMIAESNSFLAELLLRTNDLDAAEARAKVAVSQTADLSNSPPVVSAYRTLYQIAERRRDFSAALAYYKLFATSEKGYLNEVKTRELAYQIVRNENQQKNQQIELLNRQNSLLQLQQQVDQQAAANFRLYMLLFALLAATISYWAYKTKRMQMSVKRMAEVDALTDISNRNHFTIQSEKTLQKCMAAGEPVSLLMFDLDYFKTINDNYGHVTGDWVLKHVAAVCGELCRGIDHLGRIGGEEFAILLHGCDLKAATRLAEDCRVRLSRIDPLPSGYTFPISASFGVSSTSTSGYDLDKLLSHADQMLYRAKREGRNRVRTYVPDVSAELTGASFGKATRPSNSEIDPETQSGPLRA
jgi:diguanylate cyclase (GGDEF)-like protein